MCCTTSMTLWPRRATPPPCGSEASRPGSRSRLSAWCCWRPSLAGLAPPPSRARPPCPPPRRQQRTPRPRFPVFPSVCHGCAASAPPALVLCPSQFCVPCCTVAALTCALLHFPALIPPACIACAGMPLQRDPFDPCPHSEPACHVYLTAQRFFSPFRRLLLPAGSRAGHRIDFFAQVVTTGVSRTHLCGEAWHSEAVPRTSRPGGWAVVRQPPVVAMPTALLLPSTWGMPTTVLHAADFI